MGPLLTQFCIFLCRVKRLKELDAKTSNAQLAVKDTHSTEEASHESSHDASEGSHDAKESSHDANEGSHDTKEGSHDSCGPMPVAITDTHTDHENVNVNMQENKAHIDEKQTAANRNGDLDGQKVVDAKEPEKEQSTSPSTPLPTTSSSTGSGLYIVGIHRKMVSVTVLTLLVNLCNTRSILRARIWWQSTSYDPICLVFHHHSMCYQLHPSRSLSGGVETD